MPIRSGRFLDAPDGLTQRPGSGFSLRVMILDLKYGTTVCATVSRVARGNREVGCLQYKNMLLSREVTERMGHAVRNRAPDDDAVLCKNPDHSTV